MDAAGAGVIGFTVLLYSKIMLPISALKMH